ncbi:hypothetical protein [Serinicoccus kebangsaanensis]|uniref:hypothetical protein n=1 Tax=Serinicoccus kebangsaanensis TaxID=2602069 RepID=UPI00124E8655|nr:hypothetical protein [Serinicoccus kebangsaanensis]
MSSYPTRSEPGDPADEHDPTGVRDLLSALPDPGPMPADLVDRIHARLEVEREHLTGAAATHPLTGPADRVVELADARARRRPARTLGLLTAAAAGLAVTTVAFTQIFGSGASTDSGAVAQYPSRAEAGADEGAADDAGGMDGEEGSSFADQDMAGSDDAAEEELAESDEAGSVLSEQLPPTVLPPLGDVGADDYATAVHDASLGDPAAGAATEAVPLTDAQAAQCWGSVDEVGGDRTWPTRYAATATLVDEDEQAQPVVVLLGVRPGRAHAWAVPASCVSTQGVAVLDPDGVALPRP